MQGGKESVTWGVGVGTANGVCRHLFAFPVVHLQCVSSGHCRLSNEALPCVLCQEPSGDWEGQ